MAGELLDSLGPMDFLAVEFPGGRITGEGFGILLNLVDKGAVRILDLEFVAKSPDGTLSLTPPGALDAEPGLDLAPFEGASSGILDQADIDSVGGAIEPGNIAAMLVYEELSVLPLIDAWQRGGARLITEGQVSAEEILLALDATEPS